MITADTLQRFCANDMDERAHLRQPWLVGAWVYACNGHIAVRVPAETMPDAKPNDKAPDAAALFKRAIEDAPRDFVPLPEFQRRVACDLCDGTGIVRAIKCDDCGGEGEFKRGRHVYMCQECEDSNAGPGHIQLFPHDEPFVGEVIRACRDCDGLGLDGGASTRVPPVAFGEALYSAAYLTMIDKLPGAKFSAGDAARKNYEGPRELPAAFVFDGGQGILMPRAS